MHVEQTLLSVYFSQIQQGYNAVRGFSAFLAGGKLGGFAKRAFQTLIDIIAHTKETLAKLQGGRHAMQQSRTGGRAPTRAVCRRAPQEQPRPAGCRGRVCLT